LPITCTSKEGVPGQDPPPDTTQDFLINKVPVDGFPDVPPVLGKPLLTIFADLWSHESDTGLSVTTVSQFALCLVSCLSILEAANTVRIFIVNVAETNTVVNRINSRDWL
jgi:hypothetical protein